METKQETPCECPPCPGRGNDGHGLTHCAECCFGTGVEADMDCQTHGLAAYRSSYDRVALVQGHRHSEPVCAHPDCQTYLTPTQMDGAPCVDCGSGWNGCCVGQVTPREA